MGGGALPAEPLPEGERTPPPDGRSYPFFRIFLAGPPAVQPEPDFTSSYLLHKAPTATVERILHGPVAALDAYADKMERIVGEMEAATSRPAAAGKGETAELRLSPLSFRGVWRSPPCAPATGP